MAPVESGKVLLFSSENVANRRTCSTFSAAGGLSNTVLTCGEVIITVQQLDEVVVHLIVPLFGPPRDEYDESMSSSLHHLRRRVPVMLPCNAIVCPSVRLSCCSCCQHGTTHIASYDTG